MRPIPTALRKKMENNPFMKTCIHKGHNGCDGCEGEIQWEHAFMYAGQQINEEWAIVPCCRKHNVGVTGKEKEFNMAVAIERVNIEELKERMPKRDWRKEHDVLIKKFSIPNYVFSNDLLLK